MAENDTYARDEGPGFVYVMERGGYIKIGLATDPEKRLRQVQLATPEPVTLLAKRQFCNRITAAAAEKAMHAKFSRRRHVGEWFDAKPEKVIAALEACNTPEKHNKHWRDGMPYEVGALGFLERWKWARANNRLTYPV